MSNDPWIGDVTPSGVDQCGFGAGPLGEGGRCPNDPVLHVMSESAIHGMVALSTCALHAAIARAAGLKHDEHAYGPGCSGQTSVWMEAGYCVPGRADA